MQKMTKWHWLHSLSLLAIVVIIVWLGLLGIGISRSFAWLVTLVLLALFTAIAGHGITGYWRGALIDEYNKISLARLQMLVWTVIVLSGFLTAALSNIRNSHVEEPLAIGIPEQLWLLMGISIASLVGSPLIKSTKTDKAPNPIELDQTRAALTQQGVDGATIAAKGTVLAYTTPKQASWIDLFRGDETGNGAQLDIAKIQLFYFTLILVLAYGVALAEKLASQSPILQFPPFDAGMVALLGISHAGYLTNKAISHSTTQGNTQS